MAVNKDQPETSDSGAAEHPPTPPVIKARAIYPLTLPSHFSVKVATLASLKKTDHEI